MNASIASRCAALITGASKGIGRTTAEIMAAEGCNVVVVAHSEALLQFVGGNAGGPDVAALNPDYG